MTNKKIVSDEQDEQYDRDDLNPKKNQIGDLYKANTEIFLEKGIEKDENNSF